MTEKQQELPIVVVTVINGKDGKLIRQVGVHAEKDGKDVKSSSFNDNKYSAGTLNVTKKVSVIQAIKIKNSILQLH